MTPDSDKSQLLGQLRIDRCEREKTTSGRNRWWLTAGIVAAIGTAVVLLLTRNSAVEVIEATVSSQIPGELSRVSVQEGEYVHRGQVLAQLEDSSQRAALDQATAQLAAAQAQLRQYEVQLVQSRRDLARDEALIGQHLVSEEALETAQTQTATFAAEALTQRRNVAVARAGVREAQVQKDYTIVRAPYSGVVIDKAAQLGEMISPIYGGGGFDAAGVATIVDMRSLEVDVDVNEAYIHRVRPGQQAVAVLDAYPDWNIPAHLIAIVPTADKSKATVKVRIAFDRLDPRILPDMGVRVSFLRDPGGQAGVPAGSLPAGTVWVPSSAVVRRGGHAVVFVVRGDRARQQAVTPGASAGDLRAVRGITAGTAVVESPPERLTDGGRIAVKSDQG